MIYEIERGEITIFDEEGIVVKTIDQEKFWLFVKENALNTWVSDWFDSATSSHMQDSGKYSEEEYFDLPYEEIKKDIIKFLNPKK